MEHQIKKEPLFWINPNFRLNSPHFRFTWFQADITILRQEAMISSVERKVYQTSTQCVVCMLYPDHDSLDIVYADNTNFDNLRLQKWPRWSYLLACVNWNRNIIFMGIEYSSRNFEAIL